MRRRHSGVLERPGLPQGDLAGEMGFHFWARTGLAFPNEKKDNPKDIPYQTNEKVNKSLTAGGSQSTK